MNEQVGEFAWSHVTFSFLDLGKKNSITYLRFSFEDKFIAHKKYKTESSSLEKHKSKRYKRYILV